MRNARLNATMDMGATPVPERGLRDVLAVGVANTRIGCAQVLDSSEQFALPNLLFLRRMGKLHRSGNRLSGLPNQNNP